LTTPTIAPIVGLTKTKINREPEMNIDGAYIDEAEHIPQEVIDELADCYVWTEPFRDLTLEEFRARERIRFEKAEADRLRLKDKVGEAIAAMPIGSMVKTAQNENFIIQETQDGRRVLLKDPRSRKARRAAAKLERLVVL